MIADGLTAKPSMWVGSKNTVDSGGSFFFDEVFHIDGPAAAASQLSFLEDIREARALAVKEGRNGGQPSDIWVDGLIQRMERRKSGMNVQLSTWRAMPRFRSLRTTPMTQFAMQRRPSSRSLRGLRPVSTCTSSWPTAHRLLKPRPRNSPWR